MTNATAETTEVKKVEVTRVQVRQPAGLWRDGNAFAILGKMVQALRKAGHHDAAKAYMDEATAGNYQHLLAVTMSYIKSK